MMKLLRFEPHPSLKGYIQKLWVFESDHRVPNEDLKLIVPNGLAKLTIPYKNGISSFVNGRFQLSKGRVSVKSLEKETGYSSRWLHTKFIQKVGISPKSFSSVIRFQQFYQAWARNNEKHFFQKDFYDFYYDQSHFIKEFKRFTGLAPTKFAIKENEFGRIFYKDD